MKVLAFDLGASGGRTILGQYDGNRLIIETLHRFSNGPIRLGERMHWDFLRLLQEIKTGIRKTRDRYKEIGSIAIDSWALDFGLLDRNGELLGNPYHYRDSRTRGVDEQVFALIPRQDLFARTGIQYMPINSIYQLFAAKLAGSPVLESADAFLMIPDLLRYYLTGIKANEYTSATTTQLVDVHTKQWDRVILNKLGLPIGIFGPIVESGAYGGSLSKSVQEECSVLAIPVSVIAEHDTASAVVAVPAETVDFAYLSCGTWSILGTEVQRPVLSGLALEWNFTNEGGLKETYRLSKNIMGLWIIQQCKLAWEMQGKSYSFEQLIRMADRVRPFRTLIDPDHLAFLNPADMPAEIRKYAQNTGQPVPQKEEDTVRCILESLALKYRLVLERVEQLANKRFAVLHIIGGGVNNSLLCQFTANAITRPVLAGPDEATAIGNITAQLMNLKLISSLNEARNLIRGSFPTQVYEPQDQAVWDEAYSRFLCLANEAG